MIRTAFDDIGKWLKCDRCEFSQPAKWSAEGWTGNPLQMMYCPECSRKRELESRRG